MAEPYAWDMKKGNLVVIRGGQIHLNYETITLEELKSIVRSDGDDVAIARVIAVAKVNKQTEWVD